MVKRLLPPHIPGTTRQWKVRKRRELKALLKAFDAFRSGVAYTPAYAKQVAEANPKGTTFRAFARAEEALKEMQQALSQKAWGR